jgi:hypothetical protein
VNKSAFHPAFKIVSASLHFTAIRALCRIWDTHPDSANRNSLAKLFGNTQVLADLDPKQMQRWQADIAKLG